MPESISYPEAFNFAHNMMLGEEFIGVYGTASQWMNSKIETEDFLLWIEQLYNNF